MPSVKSGSSPSADHRYRAHFYFVRLSRCHPLGGGPPYNNSSLIFFIFISYHLCMCSVFIKAFLSIHLGVHLWRSSGSRLKLKYLRCWSSSFLLCLSKYGCLLHHVCTFSRQRLVPRVPHPAASSYHSWNRIVPPAMNQKF